MDNNLTNNHPTGIWFIDQTDSNMAIRISNGRTIKVPVTKEILQEIKRQIEAHKVFKVFQTISTKDKGIIGYLNVILRDYVNYLDDNSLSLLLDEMKELEYNDQIDTQNIFYIKNLQLQLKNKNIDEFEDTLKEFSTYNQDYFANAFNNEQINKRH